VSSNAKSINQLNHPDFMIFVQSMVSEAMPLKNHILISNTTWQSLLLQLQKRLEDKDQIIEQLQKQLSTKNEDRPQI